MAKITSIKKIKNSHNAGWGLRKTHTKVYDIEVENNHNYIANNLLVSNSASNSYTNLLPEIDHIYYRFGFTGTFMRNDSATLDLWGFLSNVLYRYPAYKAIKESYLTPLKVKIYELTGKANRNYQKEYDNHYCGNPELLRVVTEICVESLGQQILILVNKKDKAGKIFHEYLNAQDIENCYISGDDDKEYRTDVIKKFNEKKIKILIGSSVIGEGIDIKSTDHIIMCQGGKSEIVIVQAVGRAIRSYPGKKFAYLHDFHFSGSRYMEKHFFERKDIYERNFDCQVEYTS